MNFSTQGYKNTSPDRFRDHNIIPGSKITMEGVNTPLVLVPIIGGKPDYTKKKIAKPGDPDIDFGEGVEGVLELPYAQVGLNTFAKDLPSLNSYDVTPFAKPMEMEPIFPNLNASSANPLTPRVQFNFDDYNTSTIDFNAMQKAQADAVKSQQEDSAYRGGSNPYGGWDMNSSLQALGAFIEMDPTDTNKTNRALGIAGSAGKFLFEGARNLFSGMAGMNRFQESQREQQEDLINAKRKDWLNYFKDGGKIMTGHFLKGNPNNPNVSAEVERGEYVQFPDGETQEVLGKRHSEGGELVDLPEGTRVISDYLTIGGKLARYFKTNHKLNVSAGTKFATVLDRYKKKIGLTQLLEEEEKIMDQIKKQESIKSESTRDLNMELLTGKLKELAPKKAEMEQSFKIFTNIVFDKQEETKAPGGYNFKKQQGGEVENVDNMETQQQGSEIEQIILMFCEITGQDPADVVAQLEQLDDAQIEQAIQQMVQVIQQAQQQPSQPEQPPVSDANPTNMQVQQPQMKSGGYKRGSGRLSSLKHFQEGGISPFTESDTVPTQSTPKIIDYNGEKWQVFEHPTDPSQNRMVPVRVLDAQPPQSDYPAMQGYVSPYSTGNQFDTEYTSQHQQALEQERRNRAVSTPGSLSGLSLQEKRRIQTVLRDSGYNIGATGVDGKIGPKTQAAMRQMMEEQPGVYAQYININVPKGPERRLVRNSRVKPFQEGGQITSQDIEELIRNFAIATNQDPEVLIAEFSKLTQSEMQQAMQQMVAQLEQSSSPQMRTGGQFLGKSEGTQYAQKGGSIVTNSENTFALKPRTYKDTAEWEEIVNKYSPDPTYTFDNRTGPESRERWSTLPTVFGVTPEGVDLSDPNTLDEYAGKVQQTVRKVAPKLGDHFSTYAPATQTGLQKALDLGLVKPEELKELGVKISGDKINMGAWGTVPPENIKKMQDLIHQRGAENPDAMKEYTANNFYDNKGYYRIPQVEGVEFDTQEKLDKFIEDNEYELVEDVNGNKVYYSGKPGLYLTPTVKGQKNTSPADVAEDEINDLGDAPEHEPNAQNPFGILTPKYTRIKPSLFMPSLQQQGHAQATGISISPENTIRTLNQQYSGAIDTMTQSNPYTSGAFAANAFGQTADATNQAYMQAEALNAQDRRNVENINESRIQQRDALNSQRRDIYSQQSNQALDNYIKSWRGYLDAQNTQNARDWNLANEYNMIQAMNQDMSIGPFGNITQVGKPTFKVVLDGKSYEVDSKTGAVINKDKKPSGKKGGLLKGSIKKYLK